MIQTFSVVAIKFVPSKTDKEDRFIIYLAKDTKIIVNSKFGSKFYKYEVYNRSSMGIPMQCTLWAENKLFAWDMRV